jgi:hypothetical protein
MADPFLPGVETVYSRLQWTHSQIVPFLHINLSSGPPSLPARRVYWHVFTSGVVGSSKVATYFVLFGSAMHIITFHLHLSVVLGNGSKREAQHSVAEV